MSQQPWRDVCSVKLWENMSKGYKLGSKGALNDFIDSITSALRTYHAVEKAELSLFGIRIGKLKALEGKIRIYLSQKLGQKIPDAFKRDAQLLQHQANLKAGYLVEIWNFYSPQAGDNNFEDPVKFINYLKAPHLPPVGEASIQPGVTMEAKDPVHRAFEMNFRDKGGLKLENFWGGMHFAFGQWIGALKFILGEYRLFPNALNEINPDINNELNTPFFVWLENHSICTWEYDEETFGPVSQVIYSPYNSKKGFDCTAVDEIHWLMPSSDGLVMEFPLGCNKSKKLRIFDTQHLFGKPMDGRSAAYVWTICGTLLAGEHSPGHLHHTSFVGGANVGCAGQINVIGGKVKSISNNSGHYYPSLENFKKFAGWLNERNVFTADCSAKYNNFDGTKYFTIAELLGQGQLNFGPINLPGGSQIVNDLNKLAIFMDTVAQRYADSGTKGGLFGHDSIFRRKSKESQNALNYLQNDFPKDIETAKLDKEDPSWYSFPAEVIKTLLSKPKSLPFTKLSEQVNGRTIIGNRKFSPLTGLTPLKRSSTMHAILSEEFNKWPGFS